MAVSLDRHAQPGVGNRREPIEIIDHGGRACLNQQQIEIIEIREDLQAAPRQPQFALDRLVGVGDRAHEDAQRPSVPRASELRVQQFRRVRLDDQRLAPSLAFAPPEMPIGQHLGITVCAAIQLPELAASRPGEAVSVGSLARGEEAALLGTEDGLGLLVADLHAAYDSKSVAPQGSSLLASPPETMLT